MIWVVVGGLAIYAVVFFSLVTSVSNPRTRRWPPRTSTIWNKFVVWAMTLAVAGCTLIVGLEDWNSLGWPSGMRWGVGLPLIVVGNAVVWLGVHQLGFNATSGESDRLVNNGLYRYSRNPQYVADMGILVGWSVLSASLWAIPLVAAGLLVLIAAPTAEEEWLEEVYGASYVAYKKTTRRFL